MNRLRVGLLVVVLIAAVCTLPMSVQAGHMSLTPEKAVSMKSAVEKPVSSFAMQFDLSKIGKGQHIDMAILTLTFNADTLISKGVEILVYVAGETWEESVLARQTSIGTVDTLMTASHAPSGDEKLAKFHVTEMVQMWYDGKVDNNGFVLSISRNNDHKFEMANKAGEWGATLEVYFSKDEYFSD